MRWKLLNQDAKRGTQKKREGENTNTWNLAQNGQPWKGKWKEKRRPTDNGTRPAEKTEAPEPTWHGANLQQPQHTTGQTYLEGGERKNTWKRKKKGTHGELVDDRMHPQLMQFPLVRLNGLSSSHNPLDGLSVQPLNYVHKFWPHQKPSREKEPHLKHVLKPSHGSMSWCILSVKHSSNVDKTDVNVASSYEDQRQKRRIPGAAGSCSTLRQRQGEKRKKASSSLYLDELLIQKCKFRHRFTVHS